MNRVPAMSRTSRRGLVCMTSANRSASTDRVVRSSSPVTTTVAMAWLTSTLIASSASREPAGWQAGGSEGK